MTRKKLGANPLDVNLLVPFAGPMADEIKEIAHANGMHVTQIVRMLMGIALDSIRGGKELKLVIPRDNATS